MRQCLLGSHGDGNWSRTAELNISDLLTLPWRGESNPQPSISSQGINKCTPLHSRPLLLGHPFLAVWPVRTSLQAARHELDLPSGTVVEVVALLTFNAFCSMILSTSIAIVEQLFEANLSGSYATLSLLLVCSMSYTVHMSSAYSRQSSVTSNWHVHATVLCTYSYVIFPGYV